MYMLSTFSKKNLKSVYLIIIGNPLKNGLPIKMGILKNTGKLKILVQKIPQKATAR